MESTGGTGKTGPPRPPGAEGSQAADSPLPVRLAAALCDADRALQALTGGSHHALYHALRLSAGRLAPTDSFYVGFYAPGRRMAFPYSFDGREYDDPSTIPYGDGRPVRLDARATDAPTGPARTAGRLLRRGHRFGDTEQLSEEVIVVPIFDDPVRCPICSPLLRPQLRRFTPRDRADVDAVLRPRLLRRSTPSAPSPGLLVASSTVLAREREDQTSAGPPWGPGTPPRPRPSPTPWPPAWGRWASGLEAVGRLVPPNAPELAGAVAALREEYERAQTEVAELLAGAGPARRWDPLAGLTPRQREVARLLAVGLSAREVAARLHLSEHTVRDHRRAIRDWLGVSDRSEVPARLRRALSPPD